MLIFTNFHFAAQKKHGCIDYNQHFMVDHTPDTAGGEEVFQNAWWSGNDTQGHFEMNGLSKITYLDPTTGPWVSDRSLDTQFKSAVWQY